MLSLPICTGCPAVHCDANSRMLSVELFDTTTDQDFNIGTEMVRSGAAWPDLGSSVAQPEDGEGKYVKLKVHLAIVLRYS